jgi:hypothetical protein
MADGAFYHDTLPPFVAADITAVTLATTAKALYPAASFPAWGSGYFNKFIGKKVRIKLFGRITTARRRATAASTSTSARGRRQRDDPGLVRRARADSASQTNLSWRLELDVTVRALGASGALLVTGRAEFNVGVLASTLAPMLIPASAAAQVTVDLTTANIISVQFKRSGSTAETMQVHDMTVEAASGRLTGVALTGGGAIAEVGTTVEAHAGGARLTGGGVATVSRTSFRAAAVAATGSGVVGLGLRRATSAGVVLVGGGVIGYAIATDRPTTWRIAGGGVVVLGGEVTGPPLSDDLAAAVVASSELHAAVASSDVSEAVATSDIGEAVATPAAAVTFTTSQVGGTAT